MTTYSRITGTGSYLPPRRVTNADLAAELAANGVETSDSWIVERTGIKERRFMDPAKDTVANMAAKASRMALERAGLKENDIDFIVFATITPDYFFPGSGVLLQRELGLNGAEIVFNPSATVAGLSEYLWKLEQPAHAVANQYFVGAINRPGW